MLIGTNHCIVLVFRNPSYLNYLTKAYFMGTLPLVESPHSVSTWNAFCVSMGPVWQTLSPTWNCRSIVGHSGLTSTTLWQKPGLRWSHLPWGELATSLRPPGLQCRWRRLSGHVGWGRGCPPEITQPAHWPVHPLHHFLWPANVQIHAWCTDESAQMQLCQTWPAWRWLLPLHVNYKYKYKYKYKVKIQTQI